MCKIGDIILVDQYKDGDKTIGKHSFVVIEDTPGEIKGYSYDFICNVLSSFKNEEQKKRKLSYPGNFPVPHNDTITNPHNNKDGYIKTDQLYYFNKSKISYMTIGSMDMDIFNLMMEFLENSDFDLEEILSNL